MHLWLLAEMVLLVVIANAAPVITAMLLGNRWQRPLDHGLRLSDGRPLLGPSKTIRGLLGAICACALLAPLFHLGLLQGAGFGALAMLGDLVSSFCKRRLGLDSGQAAPLLDQIPESLLPLWVMQPLLGASTVELAVAVTAFTIIDLLCSRLLISVHAHCR